MPTNTILIILGTRPEAIKLAPVITALGDRATVVQTGQHRDLTAPILTAFGITTDHDLDIMLPDQTPSGVVARTLERLDPLLAEGRYQRIVVQGDTSSALAAALAGFHRRIPVAHVEAGLRSGRIDDPFPEEMNRRLITQIADIHFAPTELNRENLLREGLDPSRIVVVGNTVIDALHHIIESDAPIDDALQRVLDHLNGRKLILLTTHRRENFGERHRGIFEAVADIIARHDDVEVLFPVHPNPNVRAAIERHLPSHPRLHLIDPLDYISFVHAMKRSWLILTDSGGVQEEAPALGVPVLVLRETTERPEGIDAGNALLVGTGRSSIIDAVDELYADELTYARMAEAGYPYGGRGAGERIAVLLRG